MSINIWRGVVFIALIALLIFDAFTHRDTLEHSAEWSLWLQKNTPTWVTSVAHFFSSVGVLWLPVFMLVLLAYSKNRPYFLHLFTILIFPFSVGAYFKALYYRGRPFVINPLVEGCTCDPGMPSGHTIVAISTYYITQKLIMDHFFLTGTIRTVMQVVLTILNVIVCFLVAGSRVVLGAHSHIQILTGLLICAICLLYLREQDFKWFLHNLLPKLKPVFGLAMFLHALFIPIMIYVNYEYRTDPWWKYWSKCEMCAKSWIPGMCEAISSVFLMFSVFFFLPIKSEFELERKFPGYVDLEPERTLRNETSYSVSKVLQRLGLLLIILLPVMMVGIGYLLWFKPASLSLSIMTQGFLISVILSASCVYAGYALVHLSVITWNHFGLASQHDIVDVDHLDKELPAGGASELSQADSWGADRNISRESLYSNSQFDVQKGYNTGLTNRDPKRNNLY